MKNFERAYKQLREARRRLEEAIQLDFRIGDVVFYDHGEHERWGRVMSHSDERVRIMTPSQKQVWIDAIRIKRVRA